MILECVTKKESLATHPDTGSCFDDSDIIYFQLAKATAAFLKSADNMFDWNGINFPEELCFYRNGEVWLTSICHERLLHIYNETVNDVYFLNNNHINFL